MSDHPQRELAPLAALGALDGESLAEWNEHVAACEACRRELAAYESVAGSIGLATGPHQVAPALRRRVLAAVGAPVDRPLASRVPWFLAAAASLAALALAGALVSVRQQREAAGREAAGVSERLARQQSSFTELMADPGTRTAALAGLPAAPTARARVVWNPARRRAVLVASGLPPAAAGKAYEVWVIAGGAPVPAGLFQVDARGEAVVEMPWVDAAARAGTFAVTLEPERGVPAPTGPMVLAGAVS
jgi:anti-sigma-K factor RskA